MRADRDPRAVQVFRTGAAFGQWLRIVGQHLLENRLGGFAQVLAHDPRCAGRETPLEARGRALDV